MNIAVINLASMPDRWSVVQRQFIAAGLWPLRHVGIDGNSLSQTDIAGLYDPALNHRQYHKPLRPGEIGCYASHLSLWQRLLESGDRELAIFEDDIEIDAALPAVLAAIARLPSGWDVIKLLGRPHEHVRQASAWLPGTDLIRYQRVPSHTCAYVVSRRGARKLLAGRRPFGRPVDVDMRHWWENDLQVAGVQPYPVRRGASSALSAIDASRRGCSSASMRVRKLWLQARYTLHNWHAAGRQVPTPTALRPAPIGRDRAAVGRDVG